MRIFTVGSIALFAFAWIAQSNAQNPARSSAEVSNAGSSAGDTSKSCARSLLLDFPVSRLGEEPGEISVWQTPGKTAFFYESGMYIDADGAPNAYNPQNTGLDDLANAGEPGHWSALAHDENGDPYIQGADSAYPGYYVSTTALSDRTKSSDDPAKYVDATAVSYIVLPHGFSRQMGARLGDFAVVLNLRNGKHSSAIFADIGPGDSIGEGSMALAENLAVRSSPRRGGAGHGIVYMVFPGSGNGQPRTTEEINTQSEKLVEQWGGIARLTACAMK